MSLEHPHPAPRSEPDALADFILSTADFAGWTAHDGQIVELWRIRKQLANLPAGTTVPRDTLARYFAASLPATAQK